MNAKIWIPAAMLAIFLAGCGTAATSTSTTHTNPPTTPATSQMQRLPTAQQIAAHLHGTKFVSVPVGPAPNAVGQTSQGHFFIGSDFYVATVFTDAKSMNKFLEEGAKYGFTAKWQGTSWVVVPQDSSFTGPTMPLPYPW